jgi:hypothetical protein
MSNPIAELKAVDAKLKGAGTNDEWRRLRLYYDDCSRSETESALGVLGMGISANQYPLEIPILRRIVRRLANVYKSPATRWLERGKKRLAATDPQDELMKSVMARARADAVWRRTDRRRTLFHQSILRAYPSDHRKGVTLRVFDPYHVMRSPSPGAADDIASDQAFAIHVRGHGETEVWEFWERKAGKPIMRLLDGGGRAIEQQPFDRGQWKTSGPEPAPFGGEQFENPYDVLPVYQVYVEEPNGQPWLMPRQSRVASQITVNAKANDLTALIRNEAHTDEFFDVPDKHKDEVPDLTGSGVRQIVPEGTKLLTTSRQPKIAESMEALNNTIKLELIAEGLPSSDLDAAKTILTGAALRVQEGELRELRKEQLEMVERDERAVFDILRAVHNVHAESWGEEEIAADVVLRVRVGEIDTPQELGIEQAWAHKEIDREYMHPIEWVMRRDDVNEDEAILRFEHTQELFARFPVKETAPVPGELPRGPGNPGGDRAPMDEPKSGDAAA